LPITAGGTLTVPVNIDDPRPDGSSGLTQAILALTYNPAAVRVSSADIHLGTVPASGTGWVLQSWNDPGLGQLGIILFSPTPICSSDGGSLVTIDFHVQPGADAAPSIELVAAVNPGERGMIPTALDDIQGPLTLHPAADVGTDSTGYGWEIVGTGVAQSGSTGRAEAMVRPHPQDSSDGGRAPSDDGPIAGAFLVPDVTAADDDPVAVRSRGDVAVQPSEPSDRGTAPVDRLRVVIQTLAPNLPVSSRGVGVQGLEDSPAIADRIDGSSFESALTAFAAPFKALLATGNTEAQRLVDQLFLDLAWSADRALGLAASEAAEARMCEQSNAAFIGLADASPNAHDRVADAWARLEEVQSEAPSVAILDQPVVQSAEAEADGTPDS
jgi:hypothetical protein